MMAPAPGPGELRIGITTEGAGLYVERGGLRLGVERMWGGQTRAGVYYRRTF